MNALECCVCWSQYDSTNRKPCIGSCGHSVCQQCRVLIENFNCPQCKRENAFVSETIAYELIHILENSDLLMYLTNHGTKPMETCPKCEKTAMSLQICVDCCLASEVVCKKETGSEVLIWNTTKATQLECIEQAKLMRICSRCCSEHSTHKLVDFQVLQEEILKETIDDFNKKMEDFSKYTNSNLNTLDEKLKTINGCIKERISYTDDNMMLKYSRRFIIVACVESESLRIKKIDIKTKKVKELDKVFGDEKFDQFLQINNKVICTKIMPKNDQISIHEYDILTKKRKYISVIREQRGGSIAVLGELLFVCGGTDQPYSKDVQIYHRETGEIMKTCMNSHRCRPVLITFHDNLYVIGGLTTFEETEQRLGEYQESILRLSPDKTKFELVSYVVDPQRFSGGCVYNDRIYLAGYLSVNKNHKTRDVKSFNPILNDWRNEPSFVKPKRLVRLYVISGTLYAIEADSNLKHVEKLDPIRNRWTLVLGSRMPQIINKSN